MRGIQPLDDRFRDALCYAFDLHGNQWRKGSELPYVGHLLGVCSFVLEDGGSQDQAIAALLHDAVEDHGGLETLAEIDRRYGPRVAAIVEACSDTLDRESDSRTWRERKEDYVTHLEHQSVEVLRVSLADKLFNARAILRDLTDEGEEVWSRFNSGREEQLWYYRALVEVIVRRMPGPMARELEAVVRRIESLAAR